MNPSTDSVSEALTALHELLRDAPKPYARILRAIYEMTKERNETLESSLNESNVSFTVVGLVAKFVSSGEQEQKVLDAVRAKERILELSRALEKRSFGRFIVGRRSHKSRFVLWPGKDEDDAAMMTAIWQWASGSETGEQKQPPPPPLDALEHAFQLRPGLTVKLQLPADLTRVEATRFAHFVQSLPFDAA